MNTFEWQNTVRCPACKRLRGFVVDKHNGFVVVLCKCDMQATVDKKIQRRGPLLLSWSNDRIDWCPITNFIGEDGESWHVPYFSGMGY